MDDFVLVEKLQDQVEARAEDIEALGTALGHQEDNMLLVLLPTHEGAQHFFELWQAALQHTELLLLCHLRCHRVAELAQDGR